MSDNNDKLEVNGISDNREELETKPAYELGETEAVPESAEVKAKPFADILEWTASLVYAVIAVLLINLFAVRLTTVDGNSMNNTLFNADGVISTNLFYTPCRGDIVVIQSDRFPNRVLTEKYDAVIYGEPIIKRVIGVAGDKISFDFDKGEVYLNGELLVEDYVATPTNVEWDSVSGKEYVVPEGCVFAMGDNRNGSTDSRDSRVGMVDTDLIMGKAIFRYLPFDSMGLL